MTSERAPEALWQDYLFLTKQMDKFLADDDIAMFTDLLGQREKLQAALDKVDSGDYKKSPAGRELLTAVKNGNNTIIQRLTMLRNRTKQRQQLDNAYYLMTRPVGGRMDFKG